MTRDALPVQAAGLGKTFGRKVALRGVDLEVRRGTACAVVGRNGAGKSTFLRLLLGHLRPTAGTVRVLGRDPLHDGIGLRRDAGIALERAEAFGWLEAAEILRLASRLHPTWSQPECRRLVERFELPLGSRVRDLSRGQAAQISFVIALSPLPGLLVLDEPTSGLDPVVRHLFVDEVRHATATRGAAAIFTTHVMSDVDGAADEVVVLEQGAVIARGAPRALGERFSRVSLLFASPPAVDLQVPGARRVQRGVREIVATFDGPAPELGDLARLVGAHDARGVPLGFDEVFLELQRDLGRVAP